MQTAILILSSLLSQEIPTEPLGIFSFSGVKIFKYDDRLLFCDTSDNSLVLTTEKGELINQYSERGQGPQALSRPYVLGILEEEIFVCSNEQFILIFDKQLRFLRNGPSLPQEWNRRVFGSSVSLGHGTFITPARKRDTHFFHQIQLKDNQWRLTKSFLPREKGEDLFVTSRHGDHYMIYSSMIYGKDQSYTITLHRLPFNENRGDSMVMALTGDVVRIPVFNTLLDIRGFVSDVCVKPHGGFLVEIGTQSPDTPINSRNLNTIFFRDHFSSQGDFQKREVAGKERLTKILNTTDILVIYDSDQDESYLKPLTNK